MRVSCRVVSINLFHIWDARGICVNVSTAVIASDSSILRTGVDAEKGRWNHDTLTGDTTGTLCDKKAEFWDRVLYTYNKWYMIYDTVVDWVMVASVHDTSYHHQTPSCDAPYVSCYQLQPSLAPSWYGYRTTAVLDRSDAVEQRGHHQLDGTTVSVHQLWYLGAPILLYW